jgi:hypothetical protein
MARSQNWTRNISKKTKGSRAHVAARPAHSIVDDGALEGLRRRAEELGLIVHARPSKSGGRGGKKKDDGK